MTETVFTQVANGDVTVNVAVRGDGPLIVCVHGWPELWYSWRHQMAFFAERGFSVAAVDVRGYGGSSKPEPVESYTLTEICGDIAAVIDSLGDGPAIVFGHDWGAPIAYNTARFHPDKVKAVAGLSVPYFPIGPDNPLDRWRAMYTDQGTFFYQVYFDDNRGGAEAELGANSLMSVRKIYFSASGDVGDRSIVTAKPADAAMLDGLVDPDPFPDWASEADLQVYADAFDAGGWHGPLNRYRAQPLDAQQLGSLPNPNLTQPAAFVGGSLDPVRNFSPDVDPFEFAAIACDDFRGTTVIPGAGHWVQQEAPDATNAALAAFVDGL